jgi:hypothetical protein
LKFAANCNANGSNYIFLFYKVDPKFVRNMRFSKKHNKVVKRAGQAPVAKPAVAKPAAPAVKAAPTTKQTAKK